MENLNIQIVLANVIYDKKSNIVNGELPILSFKEALMEDYPQYIKVGAWNDGGILLFQPYLRVKIEERYQNADIAIKVPKGVAETIECITTEPSGYTYQLYEGKTNNVSLQVREVLSGEIGESEYVYYLPPKCFEQNPFNKKKEEKIVGHYNTIGSETIQIQFKNEKPQSMTLISKIQREEKDFYQSLVFDLVSMQQQLCMDDKSAMSMAMKWSDSLHKETERMVMDFYDAFCDLERNAEPELKPFKEKKPFRKVKKMTSQALIEHEIFHKDKVTTVSYQEDFDTFEHRVIKTHLMRLKDMVEIRQKMERLALENEKNRYISELQLDEEETKKQLYSEIVQNRENSKNQIVGLQDKIARKEEKLKDAIDGLNAKIAQKKEAVKDKLNQTYESQNLQGVYVQFRVLDLLEQDEAERGILDFRISRTDRPRIKIKSRASDGRQVTDARDCQYRSYTRVAGLSDWQPYQTERIHENAGWEQQNQENEALVTNFINISVPMDCKNAAAMLFHYLYSDEKVIRNNDVVGIWGNVAVDYATVNRRGYSVFNFDFHNIIAITLFDYANGRVEETEREIYRVNALSEEQKQQYIREFEEYVLELDIQSDDENLGFYNEEFKNYDLLKCLNMSLENEQQLNEKWETLSQYLEKIEKSSLMQSVKDIKTEIKTSNLFTFHPVYQKIYEAMIQSDKVMDGVEYYSLNKEDEFRIANLPQLYEVWCCMKLVLMFMQNYGFEFVSINREETGIESLKKYLQSVLQEKELSSTQFDLSYNGNGTHMDVTIWYDREIKIDSDRLEQEHLFAKHKRSYLRPDIIMKIRANGNYKIFVFDAKYRGDRYDGRQDLCEVAFQKYMLELGTGANFTQEFGFGYPFGERISGSFILHNSSSVTSFYEEDEKVEIVYNPKQYLGAYPDKFVEKWLENSKKYHWNVSDLEFRRWVSWNRNNDNHENRIGVLIVSPKENKLAYLIQMIMEQHFGIYKSKCWICGSDDISVECKKTEKGYPKYYITCNECNKFMVETHCGEPTCPSHDRRLKIGKHRINYYAKSKSANSYACWNVSCPKCRQLAIIENPNDDMLRYDNGLPMPIPFGVEEELPFY